MSPRQTAIQSGVNLGHDFQDAKLLQRALTHRSHSADHNERLEFLGDSVLGCVIASHLYHEYSGLNEGQLSRLRSNLVREETLALLANRVELGKHLRLGDGERKSAGSGRPSILADGMEALIGAIFLDGGFAAAEQAVLRLYLPYLAEVDVSTLGKDSKTQLQEYLQGKRLPLPAYSVVAIHGEAHAQSFVVECAIPALDIAVQGEGGSRRSAEQQAAREAFLQISAKS